MVNKRLEEIKKEYRAVPIPPELDLVIKKALQKGGKNKVKNVKTLRWIAAIAASFALFTATLNLSPALAQSLAEVPGIGSVIKVLTFRGYTLHDNNFQADLKVPIINGLENKTLESALNEKYLEENKKLYEDFMADITELKKQDSEAHMGIDTGYEVKADNERIFSIGRYVLNIAGSSSTVMKYDTIDKKNQVLITLPSLFKNEQYIPVISEYIKQQMREKMSTEEGGIYWVVGAKLDYSFEPFEQITKDQSFYINSDSKLVISFDKYEVAPGYMGVVQFIIPTEILSSLLVSDAYLN